MAIAEDDVQTYHDHKRAVEDLGMYLTVLVVAQRTLTPIKEPHIAFSKMPFRGKEFGVVQAKVGRIYTQAEEAIEAMASFIEGEQREIKRYEEAMRASHPHRRSSDATPPQDRQNNPQPQTPQPQTQGAES